MSVYISSVVSEPWQRQNRSKFNIHAAAGLIATFATLATASVCLASTPYHGAPYSEPGTQINCSDFDNGNSGDAYSVSHPVPEGQNTSYRDTPVPMNTANAGTYGGSGYVVGISNVGGDYLYPGDWVVYTTSFNGAGIYDITMDVATSSTGRYAHLEVDGVNVTGSVSLPNTPSWGSYATVTIPAIAISNGTHVIKMEMDNPVGLVNFNWMQFATHVTHTYYVSSSQGNDGNPGTQAQPFATVAHVETLALSPGDSVLFNRGDTWREVLNPLVSGNASAQIFFGAYGSGNKPIFNGSNPIPVNDSAWSPQGGNVYTLSYSTQVNSVLANKQFLIDIYNGGTGDGSVVRDPTNTPNCWKWSGGTLTISTTSGDDPRTDGKQYDVCVRDNIICDGSQQSSTYENYLTFDNLVVDECGSNQNPTLGYGVRIEGNNGTVGGGGYGCTVSNCEVYRYGRHGYAVIDGNQANFTNDYCAYPMPNVQTGQTGFVSFGNQGANLTETSTYTNCTAAYQADTWAGRADFEYQAFTDHGNSLASVTLNDFQAVDPTGDGTGEGCTFDGASGAIVTVNGGVIHSNTLQTLGPGVLVNGMTVDGPYANMDLAGNAGIIENCLVYGSIDEPSTNSYEAAIWDRGDSNTFRYNTVVCGSTASTGFATVALTNLGSSYGTNFSMYGNILLSNGTGVQTWNTTVGFNKPLDEYNIFQNAVGFYINFGTTYNLTSWQGQGYETGSIQVSNPLTTLFNNAAGSDYSEKSTSPSINFVPTSVPYPSDDILGNPRYSGSSPDAGAYEYQGAVQPPVITSSTTASGNVGSAFSYQITATNNPTSYSETGTLPGGVTLNTSTGLISGTPTATGSFPITIKATNSAGTGSGSLTITINPAKPVVTSPSTATGYVGVPFTYTITASNSPTSFGETGTLPPGLALNTSSGVISGTPTTTGTYPVTISASNAGGTGSESLTITILAGKPVITSATTASGTVGTAFTYQITATNSPTSYTESGTLPGGLSFSTSTGKITGTPNAAGSFPVTIGATNGAGTGTASLTITISLPAKPVITSATTATGNVGTAFSYQITATNNPTSYSETGTLPAGLTFSTTTGKITGTPTATGTTTVTIGAINAGGTGTASLAITINPAKPVITSSGTATGTVGVAFSYQITATNSPTSYTETGTLPAGLSFSTSTGKITGTPTAAGTSNVTIGATNAGGTGTAPLAITINPAPPVITSPSTASGTTGTAFSYQITATNSPTSYSETGTMPAGLSLNTSTGLISGTPTTAAVTSITIKATNAGGTGSQGLTITITAASTHLTGSLGGAPSGTINLTTEGTTDWGHWGSEGSGNWDHKATGGVLGWSVNPTVFTYGGTAASYLWTDGGQNWNGQAQSTGFYYNGANFTVTAPADTTSRTLKFYLGSQGGTGTLTASLSDGSSPNYVNSSLPVNTDGVYTIVYSAASAGQTLTVTWGDSSGGRLDVQSVTLH